MPRSPIYCLFVLTVTAMIGCQSSMPAPLTAARTTTTRTAQATSHATTGAITAVRSTVAATMTTVRLSLADITGPTARDNDDQVSNMAIAGFLVSHDLNTGQVVVDGNMWRQMSPTDQQIAGRIIQQYQNRNIPRPVTIRTAPSQQAQASAG